MQVCATLQVQAAAVSLLVETLAVGGGDTRCSSLLMAFLFSFLWSCFICFSLHSKLQNAVSPLKLMILINKPN